MDKWIGQKVLLIVLLAVIVYFNNVSSCKQDSFVLHVRIVNLMTLDIIETLLERS